MSATEPLPDDPGLLKAMLAEERAESERLRQIIRELQRHRFGRRAESLPEDQLLLGLEEAEQVEADGLAAAEDTVPLEKAARVAKRRTNRGALPAHLPRIESVVDIESRICPCCSGTLHRIGEDVSERLDVVPAQVRVMVIRRPRYACRSCEERRAVRQARSRPLVEVLEPWLREKLALVSQKSKLADAIRYALSRWAGLGLFLDDGRVEIDSNVVERSIRPIALTRKNALFAGSDGGAEHWAVVATLIETCKLIGVEPHSYLTDVIQRIVAGHPNSRLDELLPWSYPATPALKAVA